MDIVSVVLFVWGKKIALIWLSVIHIAKRSEHVGLKKDEKPQINIRGSGSTCTKHESLEYRVITKLTKPLETEPTW